MVFLRGMKPRKPSDKSPPRKPGLDWIEKVLGPGERPRPRPGQPTLRVVWNAPTPPRRPPPRPPSDEPDPAA
jgi:hypothetical protein